MTKTISPETAAALDAEADDILAATPPAKPDDSKAVTDLVVIERTKIKWADTTAGGQPKQTMTNAMQCIDGLGLICEQNVFSGKYTVNGSSLQTFNGDLSDVITRKIRDLSRAYFGLDPGTEATLDAMKRICEENRFHRWLII
jgi:hypothetical protein